VVVIEGWWETRSTFCTSPAADLAASSIAAAIAAANFVGLGVVVVAKAEVTKPDPVILLRAQQLNKQKIL